MDIQKLSPPTKKTPFIFSKTYVFYMTTGLFLFKSCINLRQLIQFQTLAGLSSVTEQKLVHAKLKVSYELFCNLFQMASVIGIIDCNGIPRLWKTTGRIQFRGLPFYKGEFWRSLFFIIACYVSYFIWGIPAMLLRRFVFQESPLLDIYTTLTTDWWSHDIYQGKPVFPLLFFIGVSVLVFKLRRQNLGRPFVLLTVVVQITFIVLAPILTQPSWKELSPMEAIPLKAAIQQLANTTAFPDTEVFTMSGPLENSEDGVKTFGWPKQHYVAVHESFLQKYTKTEILALVSRTLGHWNMSSEIRQFVVTQLFFNNAWSMVLLFIRQDYVYPHFGFVDEYPMVGAVAVWAMAFSPIYDLWYSMTVNFMRRKNTLLADQFAADHGYGSTLSELLRKDNGGADEVKSLSRLYSLLHRQTPLVSERIAALEDLRGKEEGIAKLAAGSKEL